MENEEQKYLGYLKYQGKQVEDGLLDARKAANALIGFDEVLRYFLSQEDSRLKNVDFEIPVKIEKGSWLALIPDTVQEWLMAAGGVGISTYMATAAKKMAENDFKDIGVKSLFIKAFKAISWVIKLSRHLKTLNKKKFEKLKFLNNNTEVEIENEDGKILIVPVEYLDYYTDCPDILFSKISQLVEEEREMEIGLVDSEEHRAKISFSDKAIFYKGDEDEEDIVLPELEHGAYVELDGHTIRGNEKTNTLGFLYADHILTCKPVKGSIVSYKVNLFDNCTMKGYVDRLDKFGNFKEKKPRVNFIELVSNSSNQKQGNLFEKE